VILQFAVLRLPDCVLCRSRRFDGQLEMSVQRQERKLARRRGADF